MTNRETAQTPTDARRPTRTFGELRREALKKAGVADHFAFRALSAKHDAFWERLNADEYGRGYTPEYQKPGSPALCDMALLDEAEFQRRLSACPAG
jgi:hypothetical protein